MAKTKIRPEPRQVYEELKPIPCISCGYELLRVMGAGEIPGLDKHIRVECGRCETTFYIFVGQ